MKNRKEFQELNRMAYPILLHYLLTSLFEILDQAIVGHYSVRGFAVVGIAASVVYGVTGALGMLSSAFHIIAAEKIGKQDERGFENAFAGSKILVILIGLTVVLVSILFGKPFFYAVYRQQGKELQELLGYFYPASFTVLQNMLIFQYSVYFKNRQNTKITLWVTVVSTTVNLFFDFVLVYGAAGFPRLGTAGAAWGSILGLGCGLLVYQITYWKERQRRKTIRAEEIRGLIYRIWKIYPSLLGQEFFPEDELIYEELPYTVEKEKDVYVVEGPKIEKMLGYTNLDSEKGFAFFQKFLKETGILDKLEEAGIQEGDTVKMYGLQFDYYK